ncbi:hypothetical protein KUTeg_024447 [Tegillarca granosa]|uniref:Aminopeptidase P N-terminal domain-containing protein n=1 Tax=Tegillarca granosa TaxID=220873 RepID=A0ABQ9E0F3_TEGGR|nr:hypothetical protein KUTeg_024447 [Tegillarca granosa]
MFGPEKKSWTCISSVFKVFNRKFGQPAVQTHPHLLREGEVTPGISKEEYSNRRRTLLEKVSKKFTKQKNLNKHIMIFPSASKVYMTYGIPYPFRQNTEFLYLCGFQEPDSVLILESHSEGNKNVTQSSLFVPKKDPLRELWDGPRSGIDGTIHITGIDQAFNIDDLESYLYRYCQENSQFLLWYNHEKPVNQNLHSKILSEFTKQKQFKHLENTTQMVHEMRLIKSEAEIRLMEATCQIASEAFKDVMKFSHSNVNESHLYAKMDFECRIRDAEILAYPPVVAGGKRANIIHYVNNNQIIEEGELVLMDAGCEYHGYTSDITRTWPVSGKFSKAQRALYDAILRVELSYIL